MPVRATWLLLADENVPRAAVEYLRSRGRDVVWIAEVSPGVADPEVIARARNERRLVFGFDLDLPERIVRGTDAPPIALVVFRGAPTSPSEPGAMLDSLLQRDDLELVGRITVIKGSRIRQRPFSATG